jgi:hypothetical protein
VSGELINEKGQRIRGARIYPKHSGYIQKNLDLSNHLLTYGALPNILLAVAAKQSEIAPDGTQAMPR